MQLISPISEYRRDQPVRVSLFLIYHVAGESVLRTTTSSTEYSVLQIVFCWLIPDRVHQPQNKLHHGLQGPQGWRILGGKGGDLKSGKYIETHRQSAPSLSWSQNTSWRLRFIFWSVTWFIEGHALDVILNECWIRNRWGRASVAPMEADYEWLATSEGFDRYHAWYWPLVICCWLG